MSRQIAATTQQIKKTLKGTSLTAEEFLYRLSKIKVQEQKESKDD